MGSLAEQLADLATPKPVDFDPEDLERVDGYGSDSGNVVKADDAEARAHYSQVGRSKMRQVDALGEKYEGKRVSRKNLGDYEYSDREEEFEEEEEEGEEEELESSSEDLMSNQDGESSEESEVSIDNDEDDDEEQTQELPKVQLNLKSLINKEDKNVVQIRDSAKADAAKGASVKKQMGQFDAVIEARIALQKAVTAANQLPVTAEARDEFSTAETETKEKSCLKSIVDLINKISGIRAKAMVYDEITTEDLKPSAGKKRSFAEACEEVAHLDKELKPYSDATLDKWSAKVQASSGSFALQASKFKALNQSASVQVNSMLADMDRLVQRAQTNRSNIKILGADEQHSQPAQANLHVNAHIFDDSDFYRLLLKDLVDKRMVDSNAGSGLKWAVSETEQRAKMRRVVEKGSSKDRKLRYNVQDKIQGFDAPRNVYSWTDDQADELFSSLLGQHRLLYEDDEDEDVEVDVVEDDGLKLFA